MTSGAYVEPLLGWKGVTIEVVDAAGVWIDSTGIAHVPTRNEDGSLFREHLFTLDARRAWWAQGHGLRLFGLETLPSADTTAGLERRGRSAVLLCEGESDALACREAFAGVAPDAPAEIPRAYYALASPGAGCWRPEWAEELRGFGWVYVLGDGDRPGREFNARVVRDLPSARPVWLPEGRDARDLLQEARPRRNRGLDPLLDLADYRAEQRGAFMGSSCLEEFRRRVRQARITYGFEEEP